MRRLGSALAQPWQLSQKRSALSAEIAAQYVDSRWRRVSGRDNGGRSCGAVELLCGELFRVRFAALFAAPFSSPLAWLRADALRCLRFCHLDPRRVAD
ncbi:MAG TPA: hypothetical protein VFU65_07330 [Actinocrinis sp.]|nr:hypothetical protein [Actinocrinis sp.]